MVLCDAEIKAALQTGQISIDPSPATEAIATTSVDLTLADGEFKRWKKATPGAPIYLDPGHPDFEFPRVANDILEPMPTEEDGSVVVQPGQLLLAKTREKISLPVTSHIAGRVEGRSQLGRLGLGIHITAPTIHAGFRGVITLEIVNHGPLPIRLRPRMRICQLILETVFGTPTVAMKGAFQDQESVTGKKIP